MGGDEGTDPSLMVSQQVNLAQKAEVSKSVTYSGYCRKLSSGKLPKMQHFHNPVTTLGLAYGRHTNRRFGIHQADRLMHHYVVGQTGTGKSTLISNMAGQDAEQGTGYCLIDPHGDLAAGLSARLRKPHIYWNVADPSSPYGYNPLTSVSKPFRPLIASGLIETLKKQWADAWGARMEHLLRYAVLALLEQPKSDLRDITRLYFDQEFRKAVVSTLEDEQVRIFWTKEFPAMNYKNAVDGVAPIANKIGGILAHPIVRKAICEPQTPLRIRKIMDDGQILIVNLAKGQLGADIANLLGGLLVSNITNAAFSRHDQPEANRRTFMLYVDEFHAFTTSVFANMLSETRKYGLGVTLAQQQTLQTEKPVLEAILGNVGTLMCFRVGAADAPILSRQLVDVLPRDLIGLPNYQCFTRLMVEGEQTKAFTAFSLPLN